MQHPAGQSNARTLYVVTVRCEPGRADLVLADLFQADIGGLEERDGGEFIVYTEDTEVIELVRRVAGKNAAVTFQARNSNWRTEFTRHVRPTKLTERITICLAGDRSNAKGVTLLELEPAFAFGFGDHATTRLAAGFVEDWCGANPGGAVLDLGTGTGVLGFVALLSGARSITGVDLDSTAVDVARRNAERNGLGDRATFASTTHGIVGPFDLVVANIAAPALLTLLLSPDLARLVGRSAVLAVTGFDEAAEADLMRALSLSLGRERTERRTLEGWVLAVVAPSKADGL